MRKHRKNWKNSLVYLENKAWRAGHKAQFFFTNAWEQRKVKDLFKVSRGYVLATTQTTVNKTDEMQYPVYSSQTKDEGLMGYYKDYLYEDAITWTTDGANAGTVNFRAGKFYCTNVCGVLLSDKVKTNKMIAEELNDIAKRYVSYVGNPKLMNNVMSEIEVSLPKQEAEQEAMSSYFATLDTLITLHQRKCENFKIQCCQNCFLNKIKVCLKMLDKFKAPGNNEMIFSRVNSTSENLFQ